MHGTWYTGIKDHCIENVEFEITKLKSCCCCIVHTQQWKAYWIACGPWVWHYWCIDVPHWWLDHWLGFQGFSGLAGNTLCVVVTTANEQVFSIDQPVVKSRRAILKESHCWRHTFHSAVRKKQTLKFDSVSVFTYPVNLG